jgi:hypothetical protein
MGGAMRWSGVRPLARGAAIAAFALATGACGTMENLTPQWSEFKLPNTRTFAPTQVSAYSQPVAATGPITAADLVNADGLCAGVAAAPVSNDAPPDAAPRAGGVALEMTECQVARALGRPEQAEIGRTPQGTRSAVLTYTTGERAGIYRFVDGRLAVIDRGEEPPPPPPQPAAKKRRPPPA